MSERLSPDRRSFKQLLSTLFQQVQRQGLRGSLDYRIDPQCLPDLIQIRNEVKGGRFDLKAIRMSYQPVKDTRRWRYD